MEHFTYTITDEVGLHARPAGELAKLAKSISSRIVIRKGEREADASRLMAVMAMGVKKGELVEVVVEGEHEAEDCQVVKAFFAEKL